MSKHEHSLARCFSELHAEESDLDFLLTWARVSFLCYAAAVMEATPGGFQLDWNVPALCK